MPLRTNLHAAIPVLLAMGVSTASLLGQGAFAPQGSEYPIAGVLTGDQTKADLAFGNSRGLMVWEDNYIDQQGVGIAAQWIGPAGDSYLERFKVNSLTAGDQENPRVASLSNGNALIVWQGAVGAGRNIYGRLLRADGTFASETEVVINEGGTFIRSLPAVTALANGRSVVVWESLGQDDPANPNEIRRNLAGIYGRLLDANGVPEGSEFLINTTVEFGQRTPAVTGLKGGGFVVAWVSEKLTGIAESERVESVNAMARIYAEDGAPISGEIRLNSRQDLCANPALNSRADGGFSAVWSQRAMQEDGQSWDIVARQFSSVGGAQVPETLVNTFTYGDQYAPRIASAGESQLVVWTSMGQDGSWEGVFGRMMNGSAPASDEFQINTATISKQFFPTVASVGGIGYTVIWSSFNGGEASVDLMAQRFWQSIPSPANPAVSALGAYELLAAWSPLSGLDIDKYLIYLDGAATPVETSDNYLRIENLDPGTTHGIKIAYRLADGRVSPTSDTVFAKTWGRDTNYDGLPDDWQRLYFGDDTSGWAGALVDSDGDGVSNLMEFLAGTNPNNASSVMSMAIEQTAVGFKVNWKSVAGSIYQLQRSEDFHNWQDVGKARFAATITDGVLVGDSLGLGYFRVIRIR